MDAIGDALLQKTYTVDFLTKKRVKNDGIVPQYYVENNHEAIIPRDLYMQVQEEMKRRSNITAGRAERSVSIAVNMHYSQCLSADTVAIFFEEFIGITTVANPLCGGVQAGSIRRRSTVRQGQLKKRN